MTSSKGTETFFKKYAEMPSDTQNILSETL